MESQLLCSSVLDNSDKILDIDIIKNWVNTVSQFTNPDDIVWCNGSEDEYNQLTSQMIKNGTLIALNNLQYPNCYLYRSDINDVARTENLTFICTTKKEDTGPINNWMSPKDAKAIINPILKNSMSGRTMYVVPYLLGPPNSDFTQIGVEITDSPYVVLNLKIMTRMGSIALDQLNKYDNFVKGVHATHNLDPKQRYICHFPEENLILSVGSGYGGNALLSKKCHALRIASVNARKENWLAEHMLIMGIEKPDGDITYLTGAFPSGCGKTNLAMLQPPKSYENWKIWTIGDDIAWLRPSPEGKLHAINPENGFFGIVSGTNQVTNQNAMNAIRKNTIYTNVALTPDNNPWWEGIDAPVPNSVINWSGKKVNNFNENVAHPNSRFTSPIEQYPNLSKNYNNAQGTPISVMIFGSRNQLAPLVYESFDWNHGVFIGATMGSKTNATMAGAPVVRRDPMAMLPFCGYNITDYLTHWVDMGSRIVNKPRIFHVNWFKKDNNGKYIWPGYKENIRVLEWIIKRVNNQVSAVETPIGYIPNIEDLNLESLNLSDNQFKLLFNIDIDQWLTEFKGINDFFNKIHVNSTLQKQYTLVKERLVASE